MKGWTLGDVTAAISGKRILVVGDLILDEYLFGEVRRISPEAPVPVVELRRRSDAPGGAANAAANVASLGCRASLAGVVGSDSGGRRLLEVLRERGVCTEGVVADRDRPTTTKTRVVAHAQQVVRVDVEDRSPLSEPVHQRLVDFVLAQLSEVDACLLSDYAKGAVSPGLAQTLITRAAQLGKPVVVDPKGTNASKYRSATLVKPNLNEAAVLLGRAVCPEEGIEGAGRQLLDLLGSAVLLTRGAQGMSLFEPGAAPVHIPALAREVYDVTGAGDTVAATLACCLAAGASAEQAARLASRAAAAVVGRLGTAVARPEDLRDRDGI